MRGGRQTAIALAQFRRLDARAAQVHGRQQRRQQSLVFPGFGDEIRGPLLHGLHRQLHTAVRGHEHHHRLRIDRQHLRQPFQTLRALVRAGGRSSYPAAAHRRRSGAPAPAGKQGHARSGPRRNGASTAAGPPGGCPPRRRRRGCVRSRGSVAVMVSEYEQVSGHLYAGGHPDASRPRNPLKLLGVEFGTQVAIGSMGHEPR